MKNHSEWIKAIRTAWLADATFAAMLGGPTEIWRHGQSFEPKYPSITIRISRFGPVDLDRGPGKFRPSIEVNVFSVSPYDAEDIANYMSENFQIPTKVPAGISTTNWRIDELICGELMEGGVVRQLDDRTQVHQFISDWQALVIQKP